MTRKTIEKLIADFENAYDLYKDYVLLQIDSQFSPTLEDKALATMNYNNLKEQIMNLCLNKDD